MNTALRPLLWRDAWLIWSWRNHPDTRKWMFATDRIGLPGHLRWVYRQLHDDEAGLYILEVDDRPMALVRFYRYVEDSAVVSITVDPAHRGLGYGSMALAAAEKIVAGRYGRPEIHVTAHVKSQNFASRRMFESAGYRRVHGDIEVMGRVVLEKLCRA